MASPKLRASGQDRMDGGVWRIQGAAWSRPVAPIWRRVSLHA